MTEVRAEQGHRDGVEDDDGPALEAFDNHLMGAFFADFSQFGIDADGVVKNVEDNKGEDGEAGPDHHFGGLAGINGSLVLVGGAGGFILAHKRDRGRYVKNERAQKDEASDPEDCAMTEVVKKISIVVKRRFAYENEHVASEVSKKESDENQASNGNYRLFANRRIPEGASRLRECGHGKW